MMSLLEESICVSPLALVVSLDEAVNSGPVASRFDPPDPTPSVEDRLDGMRAGDAVRAFVEGLPKKQRDLITRLFWDGESQASVARDRGVSAAAISIALKKVLQLGEQRLSRFRDIDFSIAI